MTRRGKRYRMLRAIAAALHRAELREKSYDVPPPTFARLPEWAQSAYIARADAALRVVQARIGLTFN